MSSPRPNPFVGPNPLKNRAIYGRDREKQRLYNLLIAERIVLLQSPSGAGKTSLIQAGLLPLLVENGFQVLPVIRVHHLMRSGSLEGVNTQAAKERFNRYVLSSLISLEEDPAYRLGMPLDQLAQTTLEYYLAARPKQPGMENLQVLLFDQFEELLTSDLTDRDKKEDFFRQLRSALNNPDYLAVFAMRDDYLGAMEPYTRWMPEIMANVFRLEPLEPLAARQAIQKTALEGQVTFLDEAADKLVEDLSLVQVQQLDGSFVSQPGPYIEPVQLQVACLSLWDKLAPDQTEINLADLLAVGDVNKSLGEYYGSAAAEAAQAAGVNESLVRRRVDAELITESGLRSQVLRTEMLANGLPDAALKVLIQRHLVRQERRRNLDWLELAHDRLVRPVRQNNQSWYDQHLSLLQRRAAQWEKESHPAGLLLTGSDLVEARQWAEGNPIEVGDLEGEFLADSELAHEETVRAGQEQNQKRRWRLAVAAISLALISLIVVGTLAVLAYQQRVVADKARATAEFNAAEAARQKTTAVFNAELAAKNEQKALENEAAAKSNAQLAEARKLAVLSNSLSLQQPDLAFLLGLEAVQQSADGEVNNSLRELYMAKPYQKILGSTAGWVNTIAFSPDGRWFAAAGCPEFNTFDFYCNTRGLTIVDLITGQENTNDISTDWPYDENFKLRFSADSQRLFLIDISPGYDYVVESRALTDNQWSIDQLAQYEGHVTQDGSKLIKLLSESSLAIQELAEVVSGEPSPTMTTVTDTITVDGIYLSQIFASSTGDLVGSLVAKSDEMGNYKNPDILLWDVKDPSKAPKIFNNPDNSSFTQVVISPDKRWLVAVTDKNELVRWKLNDPGALPFWLGSLNRAPEHLVFSPDGIRLAASAGNDISIWNMDLPESEIYPDLLPDLGKPLTGLLFDSDGKRLVVKSQDNLIRLWDLTTRQWQSLQGHAGQVYDIAITPDGRTLASAGCGRSYTGISGNSACLQSQLFFWDTGDSQQIRSDLIGHSDWVNEGIFNPAGNRLYTASDDFTIREWILSTKTELRTLFEPDGFSANELAMGPDGSTLAIGDSGGSVNFIDIQSRQVITPTWVSPGGAIFGMAFSPDGARLAVGDYDGMLSILSTSDHEVEFDPLSLHRGVIHDVDFSSNGDILATAGSDGFIKLVDTQTWKEISAPLQHTGPVHQVTFSTDNKTLASASGDATISLWDLTATPPGRTVLEGHGATVNTIAFHPTRSKTLASGSNDGKIIFWDLETGLPARPPIFTGGAPIWRVAFSPDGKTLVSTHKDGSVYLWDWETGMQKIIGWEDLICPLLSCNMSPEEWQKYMGDALYEKTCPDLPVPN